MSVTRLRDNGRRAMRALATALLISALGIVAVSCGDGGANAKQKVVEIVVPAGTQDKLNRGELVDVMPAKLTFKVGDVLRIRNEDSVVQFVGPYRVQAGEHFELKFGSPGSYGGLCSLSGGAGYNIVITE